MNRNNMPLIIMLVAGAAICVVTYFTEYSLTWRLFIILAVLLVFYAFGSILRGMLNYFDSQNEKNSMENGEVIEKDAENAEVQNDNADEKSEKAS